MILYGYKRRFKGTKLKYSSKNRYENLTKKFTRIDKKIKKLIQY